LLEIIKDTTSGRIGFQAILMSVLTSPSQFFQINITLRIHCTDEKTDTWRGKVACSGAIMLCGMETESFWALRCDLTSLLACQSCLSPCGKVCVWKAGREVGERSVYLLVWNIRHFRKA
jgi:hypothetical protein